jgi:hypothetical protein
LRRSFTRTQAQSSSRAVGLSWVTLENRRKRSASVGNGEDANQLVILGYNGRANMVFRHRTRDCCYGRRSGHDTELVDVGILNYEFTLVGVTKVRAKQKLDIPIRHNSHDVSTAGDRQVPELALAHHLASLGE